MDGFAGDNDDFIGEWLCWNYLKYFILYSFRRLSAR